MRAAYWVPRAWIFAYGLLFAVMLAFGDEFTFEPENSAQGSTPLQLAMNAMAVLLTASYLLPFRWAIDTPLFFLRCAISGFWFVRILYLGGQMALGVYGQKHWTLYPLLVLVLSTDAIAIALLSWRRHRTWRYLL